METEFKESDLVCTGKLVGTRNVVDHEGFISGTFFSVQIEEMLKGIPTKTVELYCDNDSGRFLMDVGTTYLIFAFKGERFDGITQSCLTINAGGNYGVLSESRDKLALSRELRAKYLLNPNTEPNPTPDPTYQRLSVACDFPQQYQKASRAVVAAAMKAGLNPYKYYVEIQNQSGDGLVHFLLWYDPTAEQRGSPNPLSDPSGRSRIALYDPIQDRVTKISVWK